MIKISKLMREIQKILHKSITFKQDYLLGLIQSIFEISSKTSHYVCISYNSFDLLFLH